MADPELWVFETLAKPGALAEIRKTLSQVWAAHHEVPRSVQAEMSIATGEIAANIMEHAGRDRTVHIRMEVMVLPDEVQVRFIDDGHESKVDLSTVRLPDETAERGRGLAVAKAVLRRLSYQRTPDGNLWNLVSERFSL